MRLPLGIEFGKRATGLWRPDGYLVYNHHFHIISAQHIVMQRRHTRSARASWAAVNRAAGTRNGEHDT